MDKSQLIKTVLSAVQDKDQDEAKGLLDQVVSATAGSGSSSGMANLLGGLLGGGKDDDGLDLGDIVGMFAGGDEKKSAKKDDGLDLGDIVGMFAGGDKRSAKDDDGLDLGDIVGMFAGGSDKKTDGKKTSKAKTAKEDDDEGNNTLAVVAQLLPTLLKLIKPEQLNAVKNALFSLLTGK